jgi:CCR4-NOT transcriptional regulation complex NOT5 subunit
VTKTVKPTTTSQGYTLKTCSVCGATAKTNYTAKLIAISKTTLSGVKSTYAYTGKAITPTVTVKYGSTKLTKGTDYTVSYKNNTKTGKATVTVTGKGKYSGTKTATFVIVPKAATISSAKSAKTKTVTVTWKKDTQATGYELFYSTSSKFGSAKKITVTKNSTVTKTLSSLTKGKTYYVKVRAYKTVDGKKYYGSYSAVKSVKCK